MKYILQIGMLLIITFKLQAQDIPSIKVGDEKLGITSLDIKVEVIGNVATTTYDMLFYNPTKNILEGELAFPLGEGQNVSRLALEVNGKLREAVVVEKEQGRVAFEAVVRRGVDPVLLEKGTGNNYKARIYPIPAKGHKRVVLAYEQELILSEGTHYFQLPLEFKKNLDYFALEMAVFNQKIAPSLSEGELSNFKFDAVHSNFYAKTIKKNFTPKTSLTIKIPQEYKSNKTIVSNDYFYVYKRLNPEQRVRKKSKDITLYWDVSLSQKDRDLEKELQFLDAYFKHLNKVKVNLVTFSNTIQSKEQYTIKNGHWEDLKAVLNTSIYDGGTSYANLFKNVTGNEILLFSDGMKNLSDFPENATVPVFVVNSLVKANHSELKSISETTQGKYINLKKSTVAEALEAIQFQAFKFLGAKSSNSTLEIYPNAEVSVGKDFSITGKGYKENDTFTLQFGYGDAVTQTETITLTKDVNNPLVKRIWAQKKLNVLQLDNELNKEAIITHSKHYNLVSNHTSLIVLETVWDYVRYKITPPEELLEEYNKIIARNNGKRVQAVQETETAAEEEDIEVVKLNDSFKDGNFQGTVSGTISDENGLPMPGISVLVKGTSNGTQTDFDGNYSITASAGDIIIYSSIGYHTLEADVGASSNISFGMQVDVSAIDEVVITALGIKRKRDAVTSAYQEVKTEELTKANNPSIINSLSGKVSGLQINQTRGGVDAQTRIVLRGDRSINGNNEALIVINGAISDKVFLEALDPNEIENLNIIKGASGAALYGSQGSNGVIVVTTKRFSNTSTNNRSTSTRDTSNSRSINTNKPKKPSKELKIETFNNNAKYIKELSKTVTVEEAYAMYLKQRENYKDVPAYYVDVYDYFKTRGDNIYSLRILTNIAEIDFDNYELLRVLGYKLEESDNYTLARFIYKQVLKLRPEDSQSYRDLALVYNAIGENQKAFNLLNDIVNGTIYKTGERRQFKGMETIAKHEINKVVQEATVLDISTLDSTDKINTTFDVRIVIDWNHNDTDIDLHVIDPDLEECFYSHSKTKMGGEMSADMTQGFGPEEFTLKNAKKGTYFVKVNYFGDNYQKIENPTFMKVTLFKNYGRPNETKEIKVIRLTTAKDKHIVAKIEI